MCDHTHAASVLQKQLRVPWWFIMSNTFWHLVLHTYSSHAETWQKVTKCWKSSWKTAILLLFCYTLNSNPHPKVVSLPVSPADRFLACRGLLSKWCSTSCLSRLPLFRVSSVTLQCHSSTLWSFLLPTHIPQHASFFTTTVSAHCLLPISQAKETVSWLEKTERVD